MSYYGGVNAGGSSARNRRKKVSESKPNTTTETKTFTSPTGKTRTIQVPVKQQETVEVESYYLGKDEEDKIKVPPRDDRSINNKPNNQPPNKPAYLEEEKEAGRQLGATQKNINVSYAKAKEYQNYKDYQEFQAERERIESRLKGEQGIGGKAVEGTRFVSSVFIKPAVLPAIVSEAWFGKKEGKRDRVLDTYTQHMYSLNKVVERPGWEGGVTGAFAESYKPGGFGFMATSAAVTGTGISALGAASPTAASAAQVGLVGTGVAQVAKPYLAGDIRQFQTTLLGAAIFAPTMAVGYSSGLKTFGTPKPVIMPKIKTTYAKAWTNFTNKIYSKSPTISGISSKVSTFRQTGAEFKIMKSSVRNYPHHLFEGGRKPIGLSARSFASRIKSGVIGTSSFGYRQKYGLTKYQSDALYSRKPYGSFDRSSVRSWEQLAGKKPSSFTNYPDFTYEYRTGFGSALNRVKGNNWIKYQKTSVTGEGSSIVELRYTRLANPNKPIKFSGQTDLKPNIIMDVGKVNKYTIKPETTTSNRFFSDWMNTDAGYVSGTKGVQQPLTGQFTKYDYTRNLPFFEPVKNTGKVITPSTQKAITISKGKIASRTKVYSPTSYQTSSYGYPSAGTYPKWSPGFYHSGRSGWAGTSLSNLERMEEGISTSSSRWNKVKPIRKTDSFMGMGINTKTSTGMKYATEIKPDISQGLTQGNINKINQDINKGLNQSNLPATSVDDISRIDVWRKQEYKYAYLTGQTYAQNYKSFTKKTRKDIPPTPIINFTEPTKPGKPKPIWFKDKTPFSKKYKKAFDFKSFDKAYRYRKWKTPTLFKMIGGK